MVTVAQSAAELGQQAHSRGSHAITHTLTISTQLQPRGGAKRQLSYYFYNVSLSLKSLQWQVTASGKPPSADNDNLMSTVTARIHGPK